MKATSIGPFSFVCRFLSEGQAFAMLSGAKPAHWAKNLLIFAALVFSGELLQYAAFTRCLTGFGLFCIAGSGAYLANDLFDREKDRLHPLKQGRPLAAGLLDPATGLFWAAALQTIGLAGAFLLSIAFGCILLIYLLLGLAYNLLFKKIAILDAICVAFSLLLRAFAGATLARAPISPWLIGCTLALGIFMSFAKRRSEQRLLGARAADHRPSLNGYKAGWLDRLLGASAAAVVIVYAIYTVCSPNALRIGSGLMALTIPFVLFGVLRFIYLLDHSNKSSDPIGLMIGDLILLVNNILWAVSVLLIIYGQSFP